MKKLIYNIILAILMLHQTAKSQVPNQNSIEIDNAILKNAVSNQTSSLVIDKNGFISIFGNPSSSSTEISEMDGLTYYKTIYLENSFWFVDNQLSVITVKNDRFVIIYNGNNFKVGNNINQLSSLFPVSFLDRKNNQLFVSIKSQNIDTDSFLVFNYDDDDVITEITIQ